MRRFIFTFKFTTTVKVSFDMYDYSNEKNICIDLEPILILIKTQILIILSMCTIAIFIILKINNKRIS
jgi:hypothetical protein